MQGCIFDIKKFAIHDGPGIRTTVFLKGCGLRCAWCHNPESISPEIETWTIRGREETVGRMVSVEQVVAEVLKDVVFYEESGGGVSFSGGEPLQQADFLRACLAEFREQGISTCVDTSLFAPWDIVESIRSLTDLFLVDLKHLDLAEHKRLTGADNGLILDNIRRLCATDSAAVLRMPLVPGANDSDDHLAAVAAFIMGLENSPSLEFLGYNALDIEKRRRMDLPAEQHWTKPTPDALRRAEELVAGVGVRVRTAK